ncbi:hypothetical protein GCM10014715_81530 [Streptomyces spiralis]|uniref:Uncharacterized protein n=1 Tax=Streptomyces spiralis TaxID=66376 RepID=A0A919AL26_9ACTN|nr:hypothetical protein [Streptomyces spiralis]GHF13639.1 hypothetical protein GCM10014715_81530 [Streptomyces spiralis]
MDTKDLQNLAGHLEAHGLQVAVNSAEMRLTVTSPLNSRLTEDIVADGDQWVTSFAYAIGEHGHEQQCAERIARVLAVGTDSVPRTVSA